jgi:hypothetical protein
MDTQQDKKALTQWTKSSISYNNYQDFIAKKSERYKLTFIDLLYISNFKGGNATINEPEIEIEKKLIAYSDILIEINEKFKNKILGQLTNFEIEELIGLITVLCNLTNKKTVTRIDGFSVSYLSALLNSYFPTLIPILDRRVLINLSLVSTGDIDKYGQIKNIQRFYGPLVRTFKDRCKNENLSIREIDKFLFTTKLNKPII